MDGLKKKFGLRVKELRKSLAMTQEQLAEKIGMDTPNLCRMENGTHFPQTKNLVKLAQALNVEVKDLFDFKHINTKEVLIKNICNFLQNASHKDIEFVYKIIKNLCEYKMPKKIL